MKIAKCPWCPSGGDVKLACTDLASENEYQVWCKECWAHGPSMPTEGRAAKAWEAVSVTVRGVELTRGETYVLLKEADGQKVGQRIVFRWRTDDGKFNVFNPEGEEDMQSAFSLKTSEPVGKVTEKGGAGKARWATMADVEGLGVIELSHEDWSSQAIRGESIPPFLRQGDISSDKPGRCLAVYFRDVEHLREVLGIDHVVYLCVPDKPCTYPVRPGAIVALICRRLGKLED